MDNLRPILNLARDIGFLLHGIEDPGARRFTLETLQKVIIDLDKPRTFGDLDAFTEALPLSWSDYCFRAGPLLHRARLFFSGAVRDVYETGGDVFYEMDAGVHGEALGKSAHIFVDHGASAKLLYDGILDFPIEGGLDPDALPVEFSGNAATCGLDIPFETLVGFSHGEKERIIGIARDQGLDRGSIVGALALLEDFSPSETMDILEDLGSLPVADAIEVINAAYEGAASAALRGEEFERYVSGVRRHEYASHRAFVEEYLKNNTLPDLDVETVLCLVLVESAGDRTAENGVYRGLMQISPAVFRDHRDKRLGDDIRDYRANLAAGMRYLQWCFDHFNPRRSLAVAVGNYNWGCGKMRVYLEHGGDGGLKAASPVTFNYLSRLLVFRRLFGTG